MNERNIIRWFRNTTIKNQKRRIRVIKLNIEYLRMYSNERIESIIAQYGVIVLTMGFASIASQLVVRNSVAIKSKMMRSRTCHRNILKEILNRLRILICKGVLYTFLSWSKFGCRGVLFFRFMFCLYRFAFGEESIFSVLFNK